MVLETKIKLAENDALILYKNNIQYLKTLNESLVDKNALIKGAIEGMIDSLGDTNTTYIDDESSNNFNALRVSTGFN